MNTNKMKKILLVVLVLVSLFNNRIQLYSQHKVDIIVPQFPGDTLIFGHYLRETLIIKDSAFLDSKGKGTFEGKDVLPGGLYTVYLPNKNRLDIIIDKNQYFSIITDTTDLVRKTIFKNDPENELFFRYQVYIMDMKNKISPLEKRVNKIISVEDSIEAKMELDAVNNEVTKHVGEIINENLNFFLSKLLKSMKDVDVPDPPKDQNGRVTDSTFQYRYYKAHYFDNFDISDVRFLRSPFYEKKLMTYIDKLVIPHPDSICKEVDWLVEKSRADTFLFQYMLSTLFNYYLQSQYIGMDAIVVYIVEKYYIPEAKWQDKKSIEDLKVSVKKLKPLLIGKDAPEIELVSVSDEYFKAAVNDTALKKNPYIGEIFNLTEIKSKFLILYFWEADCGHCKASIPVLYKVYEKLNDNGLQVVAVHMLGGIEGKIKWVDFVTKEKLYGWINAWNPYEFSYKDTYDITSSNIIYLFDENRTILAKRISPEVAEKIILEELKKKK